MVRASSTLSPAAFASFIIIINLITSWTVLAAPLPLPKLKPELDHRLQRKTYYHRSLGDVTVVLELLRRCGRGRGTTTKQHVMSALEAPASIIPSSGTAGGSPGSRLSAGKGGGNDISISFSGSGTGSRNDSSEGTAHPGGPD